MLYDVCQWYGGLRQEKIRRTGRVRIITKIGNPDNIKALVRDTLGVVAVEKIDQAGNRGSTPPATRRPRGGYSKVAVVVAAAAVALAGAHVETAAVTAIAIEKGNRLPGRLKEKVAEAVEAAELVGGQGRHAKAVMKLWALPLASEWDPATALGHAVTTAIEAPHVAAREARDGEPDETLAGVVVRRPLVGVAAVGARGSLVEVETLPLVEEEEVAVAGQVGPRKMARRILRVPLTGPEVARLRIGVGLAQARVLAPRGPRMGQLGPVDQVVRTCGRGADQPA